MRAVANRVFNHNPNAFLVECVRNRKPGKALDVGMGSDRNSLYLASRRMGRHWIRHS